MGILKIKALSLVLEDKEIIKNLSIDLQEGRIHAVVGPNGAGKSTLASIIMGLSGYRDIEGDILFQDKSIISLDVAERAGLGITMAWQEPARYEGLKVKDFIQAAQKRKDNEAATRVLRQVGLDPQEYLNREVDKTLSGGERKKIELASILAMQPRLVFLDEPDSGIDVESLDRIFEVIKLLQQMGATVVLITHSLVVLNQADHAFLICHGTLVEQGSAAEIAKNFSKKCLSCHARDPEQKGE